MKKVTTLLLLFLGVFIITKDAHAQFSIASDSAANYGGSWSNASNAGYGFGDWSISTSGGTSGFAGIFLGNPSTNSGISGLSSTSFSLYAHSDAGAFANADRTFNTLSVSDTLIVTFGVNWDSNGGNKGFNVYSNGTSGTQILNINNGSNDDITINSSVMFDNYGTNAVTLKIVYLSDTQIRVIGTGRDGSEAYDDTLTVSSGAPNAIRFYAAGQGSGDNRNLHFNDIQIKSPNANVSLTGVAGYRLLSAPVEVSYSTLLDPIWTQGATTGADVTNGDPNVFTWPTTSTDTARTNWVGVTDLSGTITAGTGLLVYVYADDDFNGSPDSSKTLSVSGTENGDVTSLTINSNENGWTLVGNPYASTIDFDNLTTNDLTGTIYIWNVNAGEWETWNGSSGNITEGEIEAFQGFFIQNESSVTSPSISFTTSARTNDGNFYGKTVASTVENFRLEMEGNALKNSVWVEFSEEGSGNKVKKDAIELQPLSSEYAQLAIAKEGSLLDIATLPLKATETYSLPVEISATQGGTFTLRATDFNITSGPTVTFHDYETGFSDVIDEDFEYSFELEVVQAKKSASMLVAGPIEALATGDSRFGITINPAVINSVETEESPELFALEQNYPNPFNPATVINYQLSENSDVKLGVYDAMGREITVLVSESKAAGSYKVQWNAAGVASGMYYYRLEANGQSITRKMTLIK